MASALVDPAILRFLQSGRCEGSTYFLPEGIRFEPPTYKALNEVLSRLGGKWNRRAGGHVFETDPAPLLVVVFSTGEMPPKNPTAYFSTPAEVAEALLTDERLPRIPGAEGDLVRILEPSAGSGSLLDAVEGYCRRRDLHPLIDAVEILPKFRERLVEAGRIVVATDFLAYTPKPVYDAVVMNPPFSTEADRLAYVAHVLHAMLRVRPGGVVLAVAPGGLAFRKDRRIADLRSAVEESGTWFPLDGPAFKDSGTEVRTVLLGWTRPPAGGVIDDEPTSDPCESAVQETLL